MKKITLALAIAIAINSIIPQLAFAADTRRQAEVAERGKRVMPFSMEATTHIFTKTADGGIQRIVVKNTGDAVQTKLVRVHLLEIKQQFVKGDFSAPSRIHGKNMPGLDELRSAKQAELAVDYRAVDGGAELAYRTSNPVIVAALHKWFDAQLSDHGTDAMEGHQHHHGVAEQ
jgi:hypothetical protein